MAEETLAFKTEQERLDAINALNSEPELGEDREEFQRKLEEEIEKLQKAPIVQDGEKPPETTGEPGAQPSGEPAPSAEPPKEPTQEEIWKAEIEKERKQKEDLVSQLQQVNPVLDKVKTLEETIKELQAKNEELAKAPPPPPKTSKVDEEIDKIKKSIADLRAKKDTLEKDDLEGKQEIVDQLASANLELGDLYQKKNEDTIAEINEKYQKTQEEAEKKRKADERERQLAEKQAREQEQRQHVNRAMEDFRKSHKEFQNEKSYGDMEKDYQNWVYQLASLDTGKPINKISQAETELSVQRYLKKVPSLVDSIQARGLKEPAELKQFLTLSEIEMTRKGYELDPNTGKWKKKLDIFGKEITLPSVEDAWDYMKKHNGTLAQEMANLQNQTAQTVVKTMSQRTDPFEIDAPQVGANVGEEMNLEQALKILNEMDVDKITDNARAAIRTGQALPPNVELYNRALVKTGAPPITGEN
jgi:uncharacterized protein YoxC